MVVHFHPPPAGPAAAKRQGPDLPERDIVVDGTTITAREISAEMQHHPADSAEEAWNAAAQALVIHRLLQNAAAARGLDPEDEDALDQVLSAEVRVPPVDAVAARRWHAAHPERFGSPDLWEVSHILIAADPGDETERAAALTKADAILARLRADPAQFPVLARTHSDCPSRDQGGHLGQVARGSTVPEFEAALAILEPGQLAPAVVPSRYGVHIVLLHAHAPARHLPFDAIADRVSADLRTQSWQEGVRQFIAILASRARIEGFDFAAGAAARADGPLVN